MFTVDGFWYFSTREGVDVGPYDTKVEATIEAGLLRELLLGNTSPDSAQRTVRDFVFDSHALGRPLAFLGKRQRA